MKKQILQVSRQENKTPLSPWFDKKLDLFIEERTFLPKSHIAKMKTDIIGQLANYSHEHKIKNVVLGISGGIDSALTAALFKEAGWIVTGILMPIHQDETETMRGQEVCDVLGIKSYNKDLTMVYNMMLSSQVEIDAGLALDDKRARVRKGNIRARLRMITLYNMASALNGLVASTDNYSELSAGFWTLHGDVGDLAPIQSLYKSWEVPMMSKIMNLPESVITADPTDGLGVANGDEDQFGCSYLEWDIMLAAFLSGETDINEPYASEVFDLVAGRMKRTKFKRSNPVNLVTKVTPYRLTELEEFDRKL